MDNVTEFEIFLDGLAARTMQGGSAERGEILRLLEPPCDSPEALILGRKAREMAREITGNTGRIWSAIGIDRSPCAMNCSFCGFGEKWGLITEHSEWSEADILETAQAFVAGGASWFILRTTQFYPFERLVELAATVRAKVPGQYRLIINTGEFGPEGARQLLDAGAYGIYHTLRLGEGQHTCFNPEDRQTTLAAARDSGLALTFLVEPLGPEHSNEEIADRLIAARENEAVLCGVMARVNVKGTPFEGSEPVSEARMAQVAAVSRICGGIRMPDICAHPPSKQALAWGANVLIVEAGANPRAGREGGEDVWKGFGMAEAGALLRSAGYLAP